MFFFSLNFKRKNCKKCVPFKVRIIRKVYAKFRYIQLLHSRTSFGFDHRRGSIVKSVLRMANRSVKIARRNRKFDRPFARFSCVKGTN